MLLPVSFLNKVIMNELVVLPLEVSGANFLDPHPRSVLRVLCALLSHITHISPHFYLNYEDDNSVMNWLDFVRRRLKCQTGRCYQAQHSHLNFCWFAALVNFDT